MQILSLALSFCDVSDLIMTIMTSHFGPGDNVCCHQHLDVIKRMNQRLFEIHRSDVCVTALCPVNGAPKRTARSDFELDQRKDEY